MVSVSSPVDATASSAPTKGLRVGVAGLRGLPGVMGGIETHCEELYPRILRRLDGGWVVCAARAPYVPSRREYAYAGVRVRPLPSTRSVGLEALLNTFLAVLYFGLRRRPDIIHLHGIGPGLLTPLAKLLALRVVVTHHGRDYRRAKWSGAGKTVLRLGERAALGFADRVIAVSPSLARELQTEFPAARDRVVHIPNGVSDLTSVEGDAGVLARFGLQPGGYVLSVGRLVPEKGFEDLIEAHRKANTGRPLVIAGGADHETAFVRSLREQASADVIFTGRLDRGDLGRLLGGCALFVLASHHEGLPIAALEAAASGARLLLSDIDANLDLGLPRANYFPVGNRDALAEQLRGPLEHFTVDRTALLSQFDWDSVAAATLQVYEGARRPAAIRAGAAA